MYETNANDVVRMVKKKFKGKFTTMFKSDPILKYPPKWHYIQDDELGKGRFTLGAFRNLADAKEDLRYVTIWEK